MTDTSDDNNRTLSTITGTMIPVSTDKTPLVWDGNDANILGLLYEVDRYYTNKGLFQTLIRDRAVSLSNGKLAIEHPSAVWFLSGTINDAHDFEDPRARPRWLVSSSTTTRSTSAPSPARSAPHSPRSRQT